MSANSDQSGLFAEARENITELETRLAHLLSDDEEVPLADLFRFAHNVKGMSVLLENPTLTQVAHHCEQVLAEMRDGRLKPTPEIADVLYAGVDFMNRLLQDVSLDASEMIAQLSKTAHEAKDKNKADKNKEESKEKCKAKSAPKKAKTVRKQKGNEDESVRVKTSLLDELMEKVGELVIERNQLQQRLPEHLRGVPLVGPALSQVSMLTSEIQELVVSTRLMPVANLFRRFPRLVRDLSKKVGKNVQLVLEDGEAELDRTLIEALADPLTHLIRNSLDHGLEPAAEREANGKDPAGTVLMKASSEGGMVHLQLSDDGRGIDPAVIGPIAVKRGVITEDQRRQASEQQIIELVFAPGFSTAEAVTDLSGRGVGMDVVRTNIEAMGGVVEVRSTLGEGTVFTLKLPLTMAIVTTLLVRCAGRVYAMPENAVAEVIRLRSNAEVEMIDTVLERDLLRLRGDLVPMLRLDEELLLRAPRREPLGQNQDVEWEEEEAFEDENEDLESAFAEELDEEVAILEEEEEEEPLPEPVEDLGRVILVLQNGAERFAMLVDDIVDPVELVLKPVPSSVGQTRLFSGASILGDGSITLVLDPIGLSCSKSLLHMQAKEEHDDEELEQKNSENETLELISFSNGGTERFSMPLVMVERMERVRPKQLEFDDDDGVLVRRERGDVRAYFLDHFFDVKRFAEGCTAYTLILPRAGQGTQGILVVGNADTLTLKAHLERTSFIDNKLLGTLMRPEGMLCVIDPHRLNFKRIFEKPKVDMNSLTALVVDDSLAYREIASELLLDIGMEVIMAEDGVDALAALKDHRFDLVVSDITMPRMNGYQLMQEARKMTHYANVPSIALTSLSTESDRAEAMAAGFDAYLQKLERDKIQETVIRLLNAQLRKAS